jgi:hypothetical protein
MHGNQSGSLSKPSFEWMLECFSTAELPRTEQRAARCIVATGAALLERGLPRGVESLHPRACMEVPSSCASCKICCQGQIITQRCTPDLGQKDSNAIRYEDQEVRRSNTELTDEGPQGGPIH